ncbi:phospholipase-like protein [Tanacetum coccineum]
MARCNDLYDVKIVVRSSVKLLKEIKDLLKKNPTRQRLFRRTVFGPWLDILSHDNDNHLMHYVLHHQFGRKEFCLMTGFRFGKVSEKYSKSSPFCQRLFPEKITKKGVLNLKSLELLGVLRHTETWIGLSDMDAVRVCLLLVAELVFMGKEDRNCIPRHLVSLVEDFDCWNDYPWGEYMWVKFYKRTVNVAAKHRAFHLDKKKQNPDYYPTYNLYGFPLAFKIWILESYPNSRKWWSKKDNVLPRALAWSNVTKFGKNDYNGLLGPDSNPNLELYATPVEQQTEWFKASIEYINGLVDLDMNVSEDDIGGDVSNNSFDLNDRKAPRTRTTPATTTNTTSITNAQLQAMIDQGIIAALAARDANRSTNGEDSHNSGMGVKRTERVARECTYQDFMKYQPLYFKGTKGVVELTQWFERMETVFRISNCSVENQIKFSTCTLLASTLTW